jgi:hypothetical protein
MHGSPLSKWDSRDLWKKYNYRDYGIISEPYFDIDYTKVFYITDTGRKWNNESSSVRDRVDSSKQFLDISRQIYKTNDIIKMLELGKMPDKIMINVHPHRWFVWGFGWLQELILQNMKNQVKKFIVKRNV